MSSTEEMRMDKTTSNNAPPLDLDAIEARASAADPGPWRAGSVDREGKVWAHDPNALGGPSVGERCVFVANTHFPHTANREFIAYAREDVPALLAALRASRAEVADLLAALPKCCVHRDRTATTEFVEDSRRFCDGCAEDETTGARHVAFRDLRWAASVRASAAR